MRSDNLENAEAHIINGSYTHIGKTGVANNRGMLSSIELMSAKHLWKISRLFSSTFVQCKWSLMWLVINSFLADLKNQPIGSSCVTHIFQLFQSSETNWF